MKGEEIQDYVKEAMNNSGKSVVARAQGDDLREASSLPRASLRL